MFDLTVPESLETARKWLHYISSWNAPDHEYSVVLVGNKADLTPHIQPKTIHSVCAEERITEYIQCSAKSGKNIKRVFDTLCSAIQRTHLEFNEQPHNLMHSST